MYVINVKYYIMMYMPDFGTLST